MSSSSLSTNDIVIESNITLTCISSGSPPDTFTWMRDGVSVTQSISVTTVTYTNANAEFRTDYIISNISISDNGTYTCTVTNPIGSDSYTFTVDIRELLFGYTQSLDWTCLDYWTTSSIGNSAL